MRQSTAKTPPPADKRPPATPPKLPAPAREADALAAVAQQAHLAERAADTVRRQMLQPASVDSQGAKAAPPGLKNIIVQVPEAVPEHVIAKCVEVAMGAGAVTIDGPDGAIRVTAPQAKPMHHKDDIASCPTREPIEHSGLSVPLQPSAARVWNFTCIYLYTCIYTYIHIYIYIHIYGHRLTVLV